MMDELLSSLHGLHDACMDLDIDQILIAPSGRWTIRKLGHVRPQTTALRNSELLAMQRVLADDGQGLSTKYGWMFRLHPSLGGWAMWGERLPCVSDTLITPKATLALQDHAEQGSNGVIIGPPGSKKNHVLAWLAQQYAQEQIIFVSELPPKDTFGPRVMHLFPPKDRGDARVFSRLLNQCDVVLWDRVAHPYDLQDCMGHVGATHRWMSFDARTAQIGIQAFSKMWNNQDWGVLDVVVTTQITKHTTSPIAAVVHNIGGQWAVIEDTPSTALESVTAHLVASEIIEKSFQDRQKEHTITVDLPNTKGHDFLRITREAQESSSPGLDEDDFLTIQTPKSTFTGPPQSEVVILPEVSSNHDIFEDSDVIETNTFEQENAYELEYVSDQEDPLPEETAPSVKLTNATISEPFTEEIEMDAFNAPENIEEDDAFWETTQEYIPEAHDAPPESLPEDTKQELQPNELMDNPMGDTRDEIQALHPLVSDTQELTEPSVPYVEPHIPAKPLPPMPDNMDITNNVSKAQLEALLPNLELATTDSQLDAHFLASLGQELPPVEEPAHALEALDSLYALEIQSQKETPRQQTQQAQQAQQAQQTPSFLDHDEDDMDDDITAAAPMPTPPQPKPVLQPPPIAEKPAPLQQRIQALAWGDDEETISRSLPDELARASADATSTSSSIRLNNLSMRLKTLRQQRLESSDEAPSPPEVLPQAPVHLEPQAEEEEPTQITSLPEPEPRPPSKFVIRNKAELLKRLKQTPK